MNKKLLVVLFGFLALATAATQSEEEQYYSIDQAADLLNDLLQDSQQNLVDLQNAWAVKQPILQGIIDGLQSDLDNKTAECAGLDQVLADRQAELQEATDYVAWLEQRISDDTNQIADLLNRRCAQNGNYIEGLKQDKLALKLLAFIRDQIANKEDFSLAQRKAFMKKLRLFISLYKTGTYEELAQLEQQYVNADDYAVNPDESVQDRSSDEIGTGHIDNDKGDIDLDQFQAGERLGWYQVKQLLLQLLDALEQTINAKIVQAQADEVDANSAAADYKLKLEHEIDVYKGQLAKWQQTVISLTAAVADDENNCSVCRSQEAAIQADLNNAQQDLVNETATFEHKQSNLNEEIQIFQDVIALYDPNLQSQDDSYKERVEDYNDNQNFDDGSYNDREIPDIDFINPSDSA